MHRRWVLRGGVLALLSASGCSGLELGDGSEPGTPTPTRSPPTEETTTGETTPALRFGEWVWWDRFAVRVTGVTSRETHHFALIEVRKRTDGPLPLEDLLGFYLLDAGDRYWRATSTRGEELPVQPPAGYESEMGELGPGEVSRLYRVSTFPDDAFDPPLSVGLTLSKVEDIQFEVVWGPAGTG
ncbi:MAG: hypothetical protein ABEI31_08455 [Halodesulfurarchaeum sp.]